jgi:3-oxoacyl-[acyl-carrier protein] reductase
MLLLNKTSLITGASRGIGESMAKLFASHGSNLVLLSRDINLLSSLKVELEKTNNVKVYIYQVDVSNVDEVKAIFKQIKSDNICLDILVNNAGIMIDGTLLMMKDELIHKIIDSNLLGTMYVTQAAIKLLIKNKGGVIINMSSIVGRKGISGQSVYSASKSAILGFTKSLSKELIPLNIRVNSIAPGFIDTNMTKNIPKDKIINNIGMARAGLPLEVANVALFLASDLSSYVTGQIIDVDGGMII